MATKQSFDCLDNSLEIRKYDEFSKNKSMRVSTTSSSRATSSSYSKIKDQSIRRDDDRVFKFCGTFKKIYRNYFNSYEAVDSGFINSNSHEKPSFLSRRVSGGKSYSTVKDNSQ
mmetsp:Transcript_20675/g.30580  ORF Transcript_20675/g.30580 Transcript_20675/m.30580 type:complete len:114 (+) Transcript_20675:29-370(+)